LLSILKNNNSNKILPLYIDENSIIKQGKINENSIITKPPTSVEIDENKFGNIYL
jgi:hypothetical protein